MSQNDKDLAADALKHAELQQHFHEMQMRERAEDIAGEALEAANRTPLGWVFHYGVIFFFGMIPDAVDDVLYWTRNLLKKRKY